MSSFHTRSVQVTRQSSPTTTAHCPLGYHSAGVRRVAFSKRRDGAAGGTERPGMLDALREPSFRRLWLAGFCVNSARWLDVLASGWLVLELTDSPLMVGTVAFCRT